MAAVAQRLWVANPHQYGPGKIHIVDDKDGDKTFCGRFLSAVPGMPGIAGQATCRVCLNLVVSRPEAEKRQQEYERIRQENERLRLEENAKWWDWYNEYLRSPKWAVTRQKVLKRSGGLCEGCGDVKATQVHHTTYKHVGNELLWELRAICDACHDRCHDEKAQG